MKRNAIYASGTLKQMSRTAVYKPATRNKLRGFWKGASTRGVFVPLGKGTKTAVVR
jgi:hypothetical protein